MLLVVGEEKPKHFADKIWSYDSTSGVLAARLICLLAYDRWMSGINVLRLRGLVPSTGGGGGGGVEAGGRLYINTD